jgi:hypothetical protein
MTEDELKRVFIVVGENGESIYKNKVLRGLTDETVKSLESMNYVKRRRLLKDIFSNKMIYMDNTVVLSENNPLMMRMDEIVNKEGERETKLVFVSEEQIYRIFELVNK